MKEHLSTNTYEKQRQVYKNSLDQLLFDMRSMDLGSLTYLESLEKVDELEMKIKHSCLRERFFSAQENQQLIDLTIEKSNLESIT